MKRYLLILAAFFIFFYLPIFSTPVFADSWSIDFENPPYTTGTINNQDGWVSLGAADLSNVLLDHLVSAQFLYPAFGSQSLRISNARTTPTLSDQTFSKPLVNEAGETTALNGGLSGGTRQSHFEAEWDFASTVREAEQQGLFVFAGLDRGDGSYMGKITMKDTPAGLEVDFQGYNDLAPFGSVAIASDGCGPGGDGFPLMIVASGLDRSIVHHIKITTDFVDGAHNDIVNIYVDGVLKLADTSWEDYYRWCSGTLDQSRTVDSVIFVTEGLQVASTIDRGFYIDNFKLLSGPEAIAPPTSKDQCKDDGWKAYKLPAFKNQGQCVAYFVHTINKKD